jgi:hypothetical protein
VDESETGSANFFGPVQAWQRGARRRPDRLRAVHLRPPSFDHGFVSGLWAIGLGLFILLGSISVGVDRATAFIVAPIAAAAIYLLVRIYGQEDFRA